MSWIDAASVLFAGLLFGVFGAVATSRLVHGHVAAGMAHVSVWTILISVYGVWLLIYFRSRISKMLGVFFLIVLVEILTKSVAVLFHFSSQTWTAISRSQTWVDACVYDAACIYALWWFKSKTRHVEPDITSEKKPDVA